VELRGVSSEAVNGTFCPPAVVQHLDDASCFHRSGASGDMERRIRAAVLEINTAYKAHVDYSVSWENTIIW